MMVKHLLSMVMMAAVISLLSGCVATGVGVGYDTGYYAPSYASYHRDYGYDGYPYWGAGPYIGSTIVIGGRSHRGYYGGHHYTRDFRAARAGGFRRSGSFRGGNIGGVRDRSRT